MRTICPSCGTNNDEVFPVTGAHAVHSGAISLCMTCGGWSVFSDDLSLRRPTPVEMLEIVNNETCTSIREAWEASVKLGIDGPAVDD